MSEKDQILELTDDQREDVRKLLSQYAPKPLTKPSKRRKTLETFGTTENIPKSKPTEPFATAADPFMDLPTGSTIDIKDLTPKTRRYGLVRQCFNMFIPLILDQIEITREEIVQLCNSAAMISHNEAKLLVICAVEQADPIRMIHVQLKPGLKTLIVQTVRFII